MRAVAGVKNGVVFEDHDGGFDGIERAAATRENRPARVEGALAARLAGFDGVVGDVPGAAMDDEGGIHRRIRIAAGETDVKQGSGSVKRGSNEVSR